MDLLCPGRTHSKDPSWAAARRPDSKFVIGSVDFPDSHHSTAAIADTSGIVTLCTYKLLRNILLEDCRRSQVDGLTGCDAGIPGSNPAGPRTFFSLFLIISTEITYLV